MCDENEIIRMRNMYEDASYSRDELENVLREIDFLVESDVSGSETVARIKEILSECPVQYSRKRIGF